MRRRTSKQWCGTVFKIKDCDKKCTVPSKGEVWNKFAEREFYEVAIVEIINDSAV